MAPLAGKPPYATDLPDTYYKQEPQPRRQRQAAPPDPNNRTSAYDLYDDYFIPNRNSGIDALGAGFLNGDVGSDDESDDEIARKPQRQARGSPDKHVALAAAVMPQKKQTPPPQYNTAPIAAPRPGYAAPIAALNLARPEATAQQGRGRPVYNSPSPMSPMSPAGTPHPLDPPLSPITPAFARPRPSKSDVHFATQEKSIIRGDSEETLLPKRGEKGDDFWRRFSMVVKEESRKSPNQKTSAWLRKTQSGSSRLAVWVWIVGLILILSAAGGIGLGLYLSHNSPSHQQPTAIGGSADQSQGASSSTVKSVSGGTVTAKSTLHVSPTNTVQRRVYEPRYTVAPRMHQRGLRH